MGDLIWECWWDWPLNRGHQNRSQERAAEPDLVASTDVMIEARWKRTLMEEAKTRKRESDQAGYLRQAFSHW